MDLLQKVESLLNLGVKWQKPKNGGVILYGGLSSALEDGVFALGAPQTRRENKIGNLELLLVINIEINL